MSTFNENFKFNFNRLNANNAVFTCEGSAKNNDLQLIRIVNNRRTHDFIFHFEPNSDSPNVIIENQNSQYQQIVLDINIFKDCVFFGKYERSRSDKYTPINPITFEQMFAR